MKNMMKKLLITLLEIILIAGIVAGVIFAIESISFADTVCAKGYIICQPGDYVNVRWSPKVANNKCGRLDAGDEILLDGETKNGFALCADSTFESADAWVYIGYIVFDKPVKKNGEKAVVSSNYRLAARQNCTGELRKWLYNGDEVQVFWWSEEWSVTNYGFVKSEYLDWIGE